MSNSLECKKITILFNVELSILLALLMFIDIIDALNTIFRYTFPLIGRVSMPYFLRIRDGMPSIPALILLTF